jgi:hypothetical protein
MERQPMGLVLQPGSGEVRALAVDPAGDLLVAGWFAVPGVTSMGLVRSDGQRWRAFPGSLAQLNDVVVLPNGGFAVTGSFAIQGPVQHGVAVWNGSAWSFLGSGLALSPPFEIRRLCVLANGDLVAAGNFTAISGVNAANLARWDGTTWHPFGTGLPAALIAVGITALAPGPNGELFAGGAWLATPGATPHPLWHWDGAVWSPIGGSGLSGPAPWIHAAHRSGSGLLVGGRLPPTPGFPSHNLARWDGARWRAAGSGTAGYVQDAVALPNGDLVVAGGLPSISGSVVDHVACWSGGQWSALGSGLPKPVSRVVARPDGHLFALGGWDANFHVAEWNGATWLPHFAGWSGDPRHMAVLANGDIVVGGLFTMAAGVAALNIARYDGSTWSPLGAGLPVYSGVLVPLRDGGLVALGNFDVRHWDGSHWRVLGGVFDRAPTTCVELANGDLVVGGWFEHIDGMPARAVARWDGRRWWPIGAGFTGQLDQYGTRVAGLSLRANGSVLAVGSFTQSHSSQCRGVACWHGGNWSGLGAGTNGMVTGAHELPGGDLLITGNFTMAGGIPASRVARWNGASWTAVAGGLDKAPARVVPLPNGDFAFVGDFAIAGGQVSAAVAWLRSSCPASATASGAGCAGSAGPVTLRARTALPRRASRCSCGVSGPCSCRSRTCCRSPCRGASCSSCPIRSSWRCRRRRSWTPRSRFRPRRRCSASRCDTRSYWRSSASVRSPRSRHRTRCS